MMEKCCGCGGEFAKMDGPLHAYMASSPGCFAAFGAVLAEEYSNAALGSVHRLTVDAYAVQHPGSPQDRRCVQSVGLHLARLFVQLENPQTPRDINALMASFAKDKASLPWLKPPAHFTMTVADVEPFAGGPEHTAKVRAWAKSAWDDWSEHHQFIEGWADRHLSAELAQHR